MTFLVNFNKVIATIMTEGGPVKQLEIFFDFLSPFSYLGICEYLQIENKINCANVEVLWRPVLMGNLIHAYETKGPAEIASKRDYLFRQILRHCDRENLSIKVPNVLPFNSSEALRLCLYFQSKGHNISSLVEGFFKAAWGQGEDLNDLDVLTKVMRDVDLDSTEGFEQSGSKDVRKLLKANHARALELGVFGVPSFVFEGELFWGRDSLADLKEVILEGKALPHLETYQDYLARFEN